MTRDEGIREGGDPQRFIRLAQGGRSARLEFDLLAGDSVLFRNEADFATCNAEICEIAVRKLRKFADRVAFAVLLGS